MSSIIVSILNEELIRPRYHWKHSSQLPVGFRICQREQLDRLENVNQKRERFDAWLRLTWHSPLG